MSIRTMDRVWKSSRKSGGKLLLLLAIADFANDNGMAYPGIETLSEKTRQSRRTVQRQLSELETSQELAIEPGTGRSNTNTYWVLAGLDPNVKQKLIEGAQKAKGDKMTPFSKSGSTVPANGSDDKKGEKMTPFSDQKKGDICDIKGDICDTQRVTSTTQRVTSATLKGDIAMTPEPSLTVIKHKKENRYDPGAGSKESEQALEWLISFWVYDGIKGRPVYDRLSRCRSADGAEGELLILPGSSDDAEWLRDHALNNLQRQITGHQIYQTVKISEPAMAECE